MANVKVTNLPELSAEQIGKFTWLLASHETDEHDERTSNKISYPTISAHMSADLSIYDMQCAIAEATGGQSERIVKIRTDLENLSATIPEIYYTKTQAVDDLATKQTKLESGINIKTISINGGDTKTLLGEGNVNLEVAGGSGGEPANYIKSADATTKTLTLTTNTGSTVEFTPVSSTPEGYNVLVNDVDDLKSKVNDGTSGIDKLNSRVKVLEESSGSGAISETKLEDTTITANIDGNTEKLLTYDTSGSAKLSGKKLLAIKSISTTTSGIQILSRYINDKDVCFIAKNTTSGKINNVTISTSVFCF